MYRSRKMIRGGDDSGQLEYYKNMTKYLVKVLNKINEEVLSIASIADHQEDYDEDVGENTDQMFENILEHSYAIINYYETAIGNLR